MKKIFALFLALALLFTLTACDLESLLPMLSELAEQTGDIDTYTDENGDGLSACENHYDAELDGICDYCKNPFSKVPLETPVIYIAENGELTWYKKEIDKNCYEYMISVNGEEREIRSSSYDTPAHGDVIRVKALAINENGMYLDSAWSEEFVYKRDKGYDFLDLGLSGEVEGALVLLAEKEAGTYTMGDSKYIKCANGDYIIDDGRKLEIFKHGAYEYYEIFDDCYDLIRFGADDKYEYYTKLYFYSSLFTLLTKRTGDASDGGDRYIAESGLTLLPAGEGAESREGYLPLSTYTEYSRKIDTSYLFTTYMDPETRNFDWLAPYADKINYWKVLYIGDVWLEDSVVIEFTDDFTNEDSLGVRDILKSYGLSGSGGIDDLKDVLGGLSPEEMEALENEMGGELSGSLSELLGALGDSSNPMSRIGGFEGIISVYTMPFEHEGDSWDDTYKMTGMKSEEFSMPFTLNIRYLYEFWYDGGSFATYVRRKEGLYRYTHETGFYVIDKDGNRLRYDWQTQVPIN